MAEVKTYIDTADLELATCFISQLASGMVHGALEPVKECIYEPVPPYAIARGEKPTPQKEQGRRAIDWINQNYDTIAGAFGLIGVVTDIISNALVDNAISFSNGREESGDSAEDR